MGIREAKRHPQQLEALNYYALLDDPQGTQHAIDDARRQAAVVRKFADGLKSSLANESRLHGWRVQAMFEGVILGLGAIRLLTREDAGSYYFDDVEGPLTAPDHRLVSASGEHLLVEVKSVAPTAGFGPARMRSVDLDAMRRYADLTDARLLLAHYWAATNLWTLVDSRVAKVQGTTALLGIEDAMKANELGALGDGLLATRPPLVMSLIADRTKPRGIQPAGPGEQKVEFTTSGIEVSSAARRVEDETELRIARFLMSYGRWNMREQLRTRGDGIDGIDFVYTPLEPEDAERQGFAMVGTLSSLYSTYYNVATLDEDGDVSRLRREPDPGYLATVIPSDYWDRSDRVLSLWRFDQQPSIGPSAPE